MKKKIKVALLFGGKSAEHEVSLKSAKNVADAIDKEKYDVVLIGIDKTGRWLLNESSQLLLNSEKENLHKLNNGTGNDLISLAPQSMGLISNLTKNNSSQKIDVVFPILHGPFGEDGTVQGLLKLANVPFVGAGVLGSAVGMDKDVMKRLLRDSGIPIGKYVSIGYKDKIDFKKIKKQVGMPMFIKPANLGSSVGVSKVRNEKEFKIAVDLAFQFDTKILVEEFIGGREVECAVLGNSDPIASVVGEVVLHSDFYSYETKYIDEHGATIEIPAKLPKSVSEKVRSLAVETFKILNCEGLGRVDFFIKKGGKVYVNEINTIPGFTNISMYPKLFEASGISYTELIDRLISLALERFEKESSLKTNYEK